MSETIPVPLRGSESSASGLLDVRPKPRTRLQLVLRIASAALLVGLVAWMITHVEWQKVRAALEHASLGLILLAATLNFVNLACKAARWQVMLTPFRRVGFFRLYYYLIVSYAASAVIPARAGEALRVYVLRRRDQIAVGDSVGVSIVEKLFEILGLLAVVGPLPLLFVLPRRAVLAISLVAAGGLVSFALITLRIGNADSAAQPRNRWQALLRGLTRMRKPGLIAQALLWSVLAYLIDGFEMWLVMRALSIDIPWATPGLALLGGNLAIAIPSTPGQFGALEAGIVAGLGIAGVPVPSAVAFALVYHVMQILPIVLVGLSGLRLMAESNAPTVPTETTPLAAPAEATR